MRMGISFPWYGRSQAWVRGGTCPPPPLECCEVFLCISSYSKTLSRRIIYALFSQRVGGGQSRPDPHWGSIPGPDGALLSPNP